MRGTLPDTVNMLALNSDTVWDLLPPDLLMTTPYAAVSACLCNITAGGLQIMTRFQAVTPHAPAGTLLIDIRMTSMHIVPSW